jgi:hypothetical protein
MGARRTPVCHPCQRMMPAVTRDTSSTRRVIMVNAGRIPGVRDRRNHQCGHTLTTTTGAAHFVTSWNCAVRSWHRVCCYRGRDQGTRAHASEVDDMARRISRTIRGGHREAPRARHSLRVGGGPRRTSGLGPRPAHQPCHSAHAAGRGPRSRGGSPLPDAPACRRHARGNDGAQVAAATHGLLSRRGLEEAPAEQGRQAGPGHLPLQAEPGGSPVRRTYHQERTRSTPPGRHGLDRRSQ